LTFNHLLQQPVTLLFTLALMFATSPPGTSQPAITPGNPTAGLPKNIDDFIRDSAAGHSIDIQFRHPTELPLELRALIRSRDITRYSVSLSNAILVEKATDYAEFLVGSASRTVLLLPRDVFTPSCWEKIQAKEKAPLSDALIKAAGLSIPEFKPITLSLPFDRRIRDSSGRTLDVTLLGITENSIKFRSREKEYERPLADLSPEDRNLIQRTKNPEIPCNGIRILTLPYSGTYAKPLRDLGFDVTRLSLTEPDGPDSDALKFIKDPDAYISGFDVVWTQRDGDTGYKQTSASKGDTQSIQEIVDLAKKKQRTVVICHGPYKTNILHTAERPPHERFHIKDKGGTIECDLAETYRRPDENSLRVSEHTEKLGAILLKRGRHK
jgi:hypothetical protein